MIKSSLLKTLTLFFIVVVFAGCGNSQPKHEVIYTQQIQKAQTIFDALKSDDSELVYNELNDNLKSAMPKEQLKGFLNMMESQVGKLQSQTPFDTLTMGGYLLCYSDLGFQMMPLRMLLGFDDAMKIHTLRFIPVPEVISEIPGVNKNDFIEKEIVVKTGDFVLPGTLTTPSKSDDKMPLIVLVHGSGPNDRNETVGPNTPFRDLAWRLAKRGIATIRYEKRTKIYGEKYLAEGRNILESETIDDALSAVALAKTLENIDSQRIYVLGHSLGGMSVPIIAERDKDISGIIIMAGPGRSLSETVYEQLVYYYGINEKEKTKDTDAQLVNMLKLGTSEYSEELGMPLGLPAEWIQACNELNQVEVAKNLIIPILVIQGEADYQVNMNDFKAWQEALKGKNATFHSYPHLNHLFIPVEGQSTGLEYYTRGEIPEEVMDDIRNWMLPDSY